MRRSPLRLYAPLLVIALVQALIISVAPSKVPERDQLGAPAPGAPAVPGATSAPTTTGAANGTANGSAAGTAPGGAATQTGETPVSTGAVGDGPTSATGPTPNAPGATGSTSTPSEPGAPTPAPTTAAAPDPGDTSHCTEDGRQHDLLYTAPPCVPKWTGGDNGGATWHGVTGDTIRVVVFRENRNPVVTEILEKENLRATPEQEEAFMEAGEVFLNTYHEFYGREVDMIYVEAPDCPETPPDVPACRAEAQRIVQEYDPFAVIWDVPTYPTVFDEWVKEGRLAIGGWHHDNRYFAGRRPYRWDVFMDGTRTAEMLAEYYCKKMAGGMATHSGQVIHPSIGARGQVARRLGIIVPDTEATMLAAQHVAEIVDGCGDPEPVVIVGYDQDIERGSQQANANTTAMIDAGVTTVVCMCDPIAPVFRTNNMTRNNYYPEFLLAGSGLLDYDKLGRLYDQQQMNHAFGPSHLAEPVPHSESRASVIWRAGGQEGDACGSCNLQAAYYDLLASMLQMAGPNLTPQTVEQGMLAMEDRGGWAETGGDPRYALGRFGQNDYTWVSDIREVYWDASAPSGIDGRPGAFVALNGGRRYAPGELTRDFDVPVKPQ